MISFKDQVITIEQSQKLKDLGVLQGQSNLYWYIGDTGNNVDHLIVRERPSETIYDLCLDAFTLAEVCQMLTNYNWAIPIFEGKIDQSSDVFQEVRVDIQLLKNPSCRVLSLDYQTEWLVRYSNTPTQAAASMLIKLLKMGLIGIDDVNNGLNK
jgi:hypothetical protein